MTTLFGQVLQRALWRGIELPVTDLVQQGARAVSEHEAWRRDGAELVDGGRKAYRGKVTAAFFNNIPGYGDNLFPGRMDELIRAFETDAEVSFAHPLLGNLRAMATSWEPRLSTQAKNGAYVDFEWTEQSASRVGIVTIDVERGEGDARTGLASAATEADTALAAAGAPADPPLATTTAAVLTKVSKPLAYPELGRTLDTIDTVRAVALVQLLALPVSPATVLVRHRARAALQRLRVATWRLRAALLPDPARTRLYLTSRPMTLAELSLAVYGTPFRARDLRQANALARDLLPAGRVVRALP